ncbi:MAG: lysophospholipid acyltransferase family protein [Candidatus Amulumruptor caecigallinarius]|nr:lysophospholipid acyltransferase family protein [Candidatus Amulumruptor caecigallinarius]
MNLPEGVRPELLNYDDIRKMAPIFDGHPKLVKKIMHWLILDKCNKVHSTYCYTTGVPFANLLIDKAYRINKIIDNEKILDKFRDTPFITVSNHPLGALDGIMLIDIVGRHRPDFKVMVNMFLNYITAMRPSFIAVDPVKTDDPAKKAVTMKGIRTAMAHVKSGHPIGFFPAGAVSKVDKSLHISDREWQPSIIRLIQQLKVPVIPVYFHNHNSTFFNILGMIDWRIRTLRLPRELFNKTGKTMRVSFGEPIMPEQQAEFKDTAAFGKMLRQSTYELKNIYGKQACPTHI